MAYFVRFDLHFSTHIRLDLTIGSANALARREDFSLIGEFASTEELLDRLGAAWPKLVVALWQQWEYYGSLVDVLYSRYATPQELHVGYENIGGVSRKLTRTVRAISNVEVSNWVNQATSLKGDIYRLTQFATFDEFVGYHEYPGVALQALWEMLMGIATSTERI